MLKYFICHRPYIDLMTAYDSAECQCADVKREVMDLALSCKSRNRKEK